MVETTSVDKIAQEGGKRWGFTGHPEDHQPLRDELNKRGRWEVGGVRSRDKELQGVVNRVKFSRKFKEIWMEDVLSGLAIQSAEIFASLGGRRGGRCIMEASDRNGRWWNSLWERENVFQIYKLQVCSPVLVLTFSICKGFRKSFNLCRYWFSPFQKGLKNIVQLTGL